MNWMRPRSFRVQLWLAAVLPAILLAGVFTVILSHWTQQVLETALRERVEAVGRQLAVASEFHLFAGDVGNMRGLVNGLVKEQPDIIATAIVSGDGQVLASRGSDNLPVDLTEAAIWQTEVEGRRMRMVLPIRVTALAIDDFSFAPEDTASQRPIGYVVLRVSLDALNAERHRILLWAGVAFLVAVALGGALAVWLARSVTGPLGRVIGVVERIGRGDLAARVPEQSESVLAPLIEGVNRMASQVAMNQEEMRQRIDEATRELNRQKQDAERVARSDPLTALNNRRAFFELAERDLRRSLRYEFSVALILLDLDHFKAINDEHGHPAGDAVLVHLADTLIRTMREVDVIGRLGGEEFAILMPDTSLEAALQAAERLRQAIELQSVEYEARRVAITASFGVSVYLGETDTVHDLFTRADRALYLAKRLGRNRVEAFGERGRPDES